MKTIAELYQTHDGNVSDKWSSYFAFYERAFSPIRNNPVRLLEVGIQNGGSLEIWGKYFSNAQKLLGCDINPNCRKIEHSDPRISVIIGDIKAPPTLQQVFEQSPKFDVIIDDGSHTSSDIIQAFCKLFSSLEHGGLYIIEDLHASYWKPWEGGLNLRTSSMAFLKKLADVINFEHWGLPQSRLEYLKEFGVSPELTEALLGEINSIEFANSVCLITKRPHAQNQLGKRRITGLTEVVAQARQADGMILTAPQQKDVSPALSDSTSNQLVNLLNEKLASKDKLIAMLSQQVVDLQQLLEFKPE